MCKKLGQILETSVGAAIVRKKDNQGIPSLKKEEELVLNCSYRKLNKLRNLMVSLRMCSTRMIIVRSHFSVGRPRPFMDDIVVSKEGTDNQTS